MAEKVKAKFNVSELTRYGNGGGGRVLLHAVVNNSEENKTFWENTPGGVIDLHIDNEAAFKQFEEMGEFYVEISKA